jgi:hypothetical protein
MEKIIIEGHICYVKNFGAHKTKRYYECLDILERNNIKQIPIEDAIRFILHYDKVSREALESITEFEVFIGDRVIVVHCSKNQELFDARIDIAKNIGWYPYITGVPLEKSSISAFVNQHICLRRRLNIKKIISWFNTTFTYFG